MERWLTSGEVSTVKLLYINKGATLSLQLHHHRDEFWKIINGNPEIIMDGKSYNHKVGDEILVKKETTHRISAPLDDVVVLEISTGDFDEKDEVRLEDEYNRV